MPPPPARRKAPYPPAARFVAKLPAISGNTVNGVGEAAERRPSPFFWHPPHLHAFGALQREVVDYMHRSPAIGRAFSPRADRGPRPIARAPRRVERPAAAWAETVKAFARAHEADLVGVAALDPLWVFEGYAIEEPWVVVLGVAMDHARLDQMPPTFANPTASVEVGDKYNQAARSCRALTNFILAQGYAARAFQGPYASALNMIPAALAAGFGELGKHGSIISRELGSSFRLSAVTTDLPLVADAPDAFGVDAFCAGCQVCSNACPPDAIAPEKVLVRGRLKWYVDFDKCIPYFGEALGCAACIAKCPWSTPGRAPRLAARWARRAARAAPED